MVLSWTVLNVSCAVVIMIIAFWLRPAYIFCVVCVQQGGSTDSWKYRVTDISFCASVIVGCPHLYSRSFGRSRSALGCGVLYCAISCSGGAWPKTTHFWAISFLGNGGVCLSRLLNRPKTVLCTLGSRAFHYCLFERAVCLVCASLLSFLLTMIGIF